MDIIQARRKGPVPNLHRIPDVHSPHRDPLALHIQQKKPVILDEPSIVPGKARTCSEQARPEKCC